jgi:hypothetical protein
MTASADQWSFPRTQAVRQALQSVRDEAIAADLLFLEAWEADPVPSIAATLRAGQIRRANPDLAAAIRAELNAPSSAMLRAASAPASGRR